jgi:hypothetical protein
MLTPASKRKLAQLAERPDSEIDFSDIPPLTESFWKNAVRNPFYRPVKQQLTVRLDARCRGVSSPPGQRLSDPAQSGAPQGDAGRDQKERLRLTVSPRRWQWIVSDLQDLEILAERGGFEPPVEV